MNENAFAIKGDIVWSRHNHTLSWAKDGYLVVVDGIVQGVYQELPAEYEGIRIVDHTGKLVIPGMNDIHVHAPQYSFRGMGMDLELLEWLNTHTFPEESKYADLSYAERAYDIFSDDLLHSPTTRAVVFGTMHVEPTELLMDKLEATGLKTYVGKVNMDRNSPDYLCEKDAATSLADTVRWLNDVEAKGYANTKPILTPRFTPTCSDELMEGLGKLKQERGLPLQSHLSENLSEIDWVHGLAPWSTCYGETYEHFGQLDGEGKTVMAHCNYSTDEEIAILKKHNVFVATCPQSNMQLSSGIAPIRRYLVEGMNVGLGTDVAGGASLSMFRAVADLVGCSKLRWRLVDQNLKPLSTAEAFYIATVLWQGGHLRAGIRGGRPGSGRLRPAYDARVQPGGARGALYVPRRGGWSPRREVRGWCTRAVSALAPGILGARRLSALLEPLLFFVNNDQLRGHVRPLRTDERSAAVCDHSPLPRL